MRGEEQNFIRILQMLQILTHSERKIVTGGRAAMLKVKRNHETVVKTNG